MEPSALTESVSVGTHCLGPQRAALIALLQGMDAGWASPTEYPAYSVKGIATHILGDDVSLLSRQRDAAASGLVLVAEKMPGADFRTLLNAFNDQWVVVATFLSSALLIELLGLTGGMDRPVPHRRRPRPCGRTSLGFCDAPAGRSPFWQAIAREYLERWAHHSQIRRALGMSSLAESPFIDVGSETSPRPPVYQRSHLRSTPRCGRSGRSFLARGNKPPTS